MQRRHFLATAAASAAMGVLLPGCERAPRALQGRFTGIDMARGHQLRDWLQTGNLPAPTVVRRAPVIIAGGGVAGLAAARSLRLAGVNDFALLELEDTAGGNSRGGVVSGIACPLGAHYLPVPGDDAREVQDLLEELGLRRRVAGRWQYDERHLCHSPQERLFFDGEWQEGLLPVQGVGEATLAQYRRFALAVERESKAARFAMPALKLWGTKQPLAPAHQALDAITFSVWLAQEGLDDEHLLWYLNYCCRDDYGAGTDRVSAWAGIHYFASRHGFHAPGDAVDEARESVLTWPEGNGWITHRLAEPLRTGGQLRTATSVLRITESRHGVHVDAFNHATGSVERWQAPRCIVALPVFVAARVVQSPPAFLAAAAQRLQWAPWLVANIHIDSPLTDRPGAAPAWDNVLYADPTAGGLGYVNAGHQRLDVGAAIAGPTVLSYYQALGDVPDARQQLATAPWQQWADAALTALAVPHPDLRQRATRVDITRYGHAMSIPVQGTQSFLSQIGLQRLSGKRKQLSNGEQAAWIPTPATARLAFAHSDWSGYSVFEEAFTRGHGAGLVAASA
ncbi:twin-arginine translocation pathway signal protein [Acidovorax sp. NO-1]|uniref:NAD(P)-binding protein n=1 Tax=Acidovorax sp. NO-1 TaxID=512030 RepID=UPI00023FCACA|nr:NAD(P)-binding protein [Acidovorax sp. NO-1]EHL24767.1 twin-arginine translocation pathway signal protein [Acidovorax sp. NO-1]